MLTTQETEILVSALEKKGISVKIPGTIYCEESVMIDASQRDERIEKELRERIAKAIGETNPTFVPMPDSVWKECASKVIRKI